jgi:hypothetical protein
MVNGNNIYDTADNSINNSCAGAAKSGTPKSSSAVTICMIEQTIKSTTATGKAKLSSAATIT